MRYIFKQMRWSVRKTAFPCNSCGLCCKNIGHIEELKSFDNGDGTCMYLENNMCRIYATRPLICRIDEMYEQFFHEQLSKEEYYDINIKACQQLQREEGWNESEIKWDEGPVLPSRMEE